MSKDIERINILHRLQNNFEVDESVSDLLKNQIENEDVKKRISTFYKGYSIEENFKILFSAIPWVKLIHGLDQKQYPDRSKRNYQVPDHLLYFETYSLTNMPLLIEVKSVTGKKQSLSVQNKQIDASLEYANVIGVTLLYAIFWEQFNFWSLNTLENFSRRASSTSISMFTAYENNLTLILGDIDFFIDKEIFRKTEYDMAQPSKGAGHSIYGTVISDSVSIDGESFEDLSSLDSAIIDSSISMGELSKKVNGTRTIVVEKSKGFYALKLSATILRHIAMFGISLDEKLALLSSNMVVEFFRRLKMPEIYVVPKMKTTISDSLFIRAFNKKWLDHNYFDN